MPIYNNPAIGQAFTNIASMFAPPSAAELAGYASAKAKNEEAARATEAWQKMTDPASGHTVADMYNYALNGNANNTYYSVDQDNATTRRGQDVAAETSASNNAADNKRLTITSLFQPLNQGQIRPAVPASIAGLAGLPAIDQSAGLEKPLSETEWQARQNERLRQSGKLSDDELLNALAGKETPVQAVGQNGKPQFMSPGQAVRSGAEPYSAPSAGADVEEAMAVIDGKTVPVFRKKGTMAYVMADGTPKPADAPVYDRPKPTGTAGDLGLPKQTERDSVISLTGENIAPGLAVLNQAYSGDKSISQGALTVKSVFGENPAVKNIAQGLGIINPTDQSIMNGINSVMNYLYLQTGAARSPGEDERGYNDLVPLTSDTAETRQLKRDMFNQKAMSIINQAKSPELRDKLVKAMQGNFASPVENEQRPSETMADANSDPLAAARDAIARGAPRDKVIERLRQHGIVTECL